MFAITRHISVNDAATPEPARRFFASRAGARKALKGIADVRRTKIKAQGWAWKETPDSVEYTLGPVTIDPIRVRYAILTLTLEP